MSNHKSLSRLLCLLLLTLLCFPGHEAWLFGAGSEEEAAAGDEEDLPIKADIPEKPVGGPAPTPPSEEEEEDEKLSFKNAGEEMDHLNTIAHPEAEKLGHDHYQDGQHNADFDHQSILGSREEAQEYENLPPEEAKKRLAKLVTKMDANGDGSVSHEELQNWITNSFLSLNEEESKDRFKEHDQDSDGKLSWEEYLRSVYGYIPTLSELSNEDLNPDAKHFVRIYKEDEAKFRACDRDSDGILDAKEFLAFYHPEDFDFMHEIERQRVLEENDKDADGAISLEEYLGQIPESEMDEWAAHEKDRFERSLDADKNGRLEGDEVLAWAVPSNVEIAKDEATHLLGVADSNRDALLSLEEILSESELFVGSAATDYGKRLEDEL